MNKIKIICILSTLILVGAGCTQNDSKIRKIAVIKYVSHPALNELEESFIASFNKVKITDSTTKNYEVISYNANADINSVRKIAQSLKTKNVDLVLSIATPTAITVSSLSLDIPHLYGAVADPKGAGIIPSKSTTGIQNAGENIIRRAVSFISKTFEIKGKPLSIGTIYNPKEQNSLFVQKHLKAITEEKNINLLQVTSDSSSQFKSIANSLSERVDVIYSANDNTVNSGIIALTSVTNHQKKPFIIGDLSTLDKGALFAVGLSYSEMGKDLADMARVILTEKTVANVPPRGAPEPAIFFNKAVGDSIGFILVDEIKDEFSVQVKN